MTRFIPREILARIANPRLAEGAVPDALRCELDREPPKVFLADPGPFAPAAELRIDPLPEGSRVILRLMWGPLPAPFPRALAALGLLLALALLVLFSASALGLGAAALLILLPAAALWRQRSGERRLQDHLSVLLGDCNWTPRPH